MLDTFSKTNKNKCREGFGTSFVAHLSEVTVLGAGSRHLGSLSGGVHGQPVAVIAANAPHVIGARQLIFLVGHAGVTGTAYI